MKERVGSVALVGAGPGDPGLISMKGLQALQTADVIFYDRLIAPSLLGEAPTDAEKIYVGKSPQGAAMTQRQIEAAMIAAARRGRRVVRLKGGDPFLFGRGGEEALALREAGIPFEVIPGVTSALAVPAYAGVPVTQRGMADGVAVWTATHADGSVRAPIDAPTQVVLMGVRSLPRTVEEIKRQGRPPETPAAVIVWGTTGAQRVVRGCLANIVEKAVKEGVTNPAVIVVGEVAALADRLAWWEPRGAWRGRRVVITRPAEHDDPLVASLRSEGAEVVRLPLYRWEPDAEGLDAFAASLRGLKSIHFNDARAVEWSILHLLERGMDVRAMAHLSISAGNEETAVALRRFGLLVGGGGEASAARGGTGDVECLGAGRAVVGCDRMQGEYETNRFTVGRWLPVEENVRTLVDLAAAGMIDAVVIDTEEAGAVVARRAELRAVGTGLCDRR